MASVGDFVTPPSGGDTPSLIACTQFSVLGEGCPACGGWLYADDNGELSGVPVAVPGGMTVCSEPECAEHERQRVASFDERRNQ